MAEKVSSTPSSTGIGQGAAQVLSAQIGTLDYRSMQRAAEAIGQGAQEIVRQMQEKKDKTEALKRAYDLKVADSGGLKFKKYQSARDAVIEDMTNKLAEATTDAERATIYNENLGQLAMIKAEDIRNQQIFQNLDPEKAPKIFSSAEDGSVTSFYDGLEKSLNTGITEEESTILFSDGAGAFTEATEPTKLFRNRFVYGGTPETVGLAEATGIIKQMAVNKTLPVEAIVEDGSGNIDVYKTFERLDADQRDVINQAMLNPNSAFSQAYRADRAIAGGNINVPRTEDEELGFSYFEGQKELLDQILPTTLAVDTKIYKGAADGTGGATGTGDATQAVTSFTKEPTQPFIQDNKVVSLPSFNTGSGFEVEGEDGTKYKITGVAYNPETGMKMAIDEQSRVIAADNAQLSNSLATTWENQFVSNKPENKQSLTSAFNEIKGMESTVADYAEDEAKVAEFQSSLEAFGSGVEDEEGLYDYLAGLTGMTAEQVKQSRISGPNSRTIEDRFEGLAGGESIKSPESISALKNWVLSQNPYLFLNAAGVYEQQREKIKGLKTGTGTSTVTTPTTGTTFNAEAFYNNYKTGR